MGPVTELSAEFDAGLLSQNPSSFSCSRNKERAQFRVNRSSPGARLLGMRMATASILILLAAALAGAQTPDQSADFKLALPNHAGQLRWRAEGFKIMEASAKPNGQEIGFRGERDSDGLSFLGFLFLFPEQAPMTSLKCRDGILDPAKKANPSLAILQTSRVASADGQQIELVRYGTGGNGGNTVRAFVAMGDICGDLEFYSRVPITAEDGDLKKILTSIRFTPNYVPQFEDAFLYAQILYRNDMYKAAAPVFEQAIQKLKGRNEPALKSLQRMATDNAGMAYGLSGDLAKARAVFETAIKTDPDYPLYYYNLACADAEEGKLSEARGHLEQAFARKANVIPGETMPDPSTDDSFLPHKANKEFWKFVETLH